MKQKLKKSTALAISFVMIFLLAGCKNGDDEKTSKEEKKNEVSAEYGYNVDYKELNGINSMGNIAKSGNTIYFTDSSSEENSDKSITMIRSIDITSPENIKTYANYENDYSENGPNTYTEIPYIYPNNDGTITYMKIDITYDENTSNPVTGSIDLGDIPEGAAITEEYIQQLNLDLESVGLKFSELNGMTVKQVVDLYQQLASGDEPNHTDNNYENIVTTLITVDADGKELSSKDISSQLKEPFGSGFVFDKDGNLYIYSQEWDKIDSDKSENYLTIFNISSLESETLKLDDIEIQKIMLTENGDIAAVIMDEDYNCKIVAWDKDKKKFASGENSSPTAMWIDEIFQADGDNIYYVNEGILYKYNLKKGKDVQILKFMDWNVSPDRIVDIAHIDEEHLNIITSETSSGKDILMLNKLTRVKASEITRKTEITLGCLGADDSIKSAVIEFNKTSSNYKIVIKEYLDYNDENFDYDASITKFNNDILSGNGPDLIDLSSLDFSQYEGSGLFADLYEYIRKDEDFSKLNLNENIIKLFEQDEKLLALPTSYTITALASAKSVLGDSPFTIDKLAELISNNPDKDMFENISQKEILHTLLLYNEDSFVDYKNKTCNFTDGNFEKILNIAKTYPSEQELESMQPGDEDEFDVKRVYEGRQLFYRMHLNDPNEYQIANYILKNDIQISGYPSVEGNKLAAYVPSCLFAIHAKSDYKDDCWNFIKILYDKISSQGYYNGFPVDNDKLDEMLKEYATPNMVEDENGNQVEQPSIYGFNDMEIKIYALTEEQVNTIKELTKSVSVLAPQDYSGDLFEIVDEESASFFHGEKSATDVCNVIQSRINIKINEKN